MRVRVRVRDELIIDFGTDLDEALNKFLYYFKWCVV